MALDRDGMKLIFRNTAFIPIGVIEKKKWLRKREVVSFFVFC